MILRSLLLLGVGAAIACASPAFAAATTAQTDKTETSAAATPKVAALQADEPKADTPAVKKTKAKAAAKKTTKKVAKARKKPAAEVAEEEDNGFFSRLFGGEIKRKPSAELKADTKAKTKKTVAKVEPEPVEEEPVLASITGNSGELRSEAQKKPTLFSALFGAGPQMLPETRALDGVLEKKQGNKKFKLKPDFMPQEVEFSGYDRGTIVIDTGAKFLYLVEDSSTARRYAIAVGREGLEFKGEAKVGDKQEWPRWIPTKEMQEREPKKYGQYKDGMNGGPENPLGARAIYLYQGKKDTHIRIHGTNQPQSIGTSASNGCFRMINDHVIDLYSRVRLGTPVVVL